MYTDITFGLSAAFVLGGLFALAWSSDVFVAGPGLAAISLFSLWILKDGVCSRFEAICLLAAFVVVLPLYCWHEQKAKGGVNAAEAGKEADGTGDGRLSARPRCGWFAGVFALHPDT